MSQRGDIELSNVINNDKTKWISSFVLFIFYFYLCVTIINTEGFYLS